jgi:hypothetical protein
MARKSVLSNCHSFYGGIMKISLISCVLVILFLTFGCKSDKDSETILDPEGANTLVEEANQALETVLFNLINDGVEEPADIDFSLPNSLYKQAYEKDPENKDANFGLALTDMMMMSQDDQRLNDLFHNWDDYLNSDSDSPGTAPGFPGSVNALEIGTRQLIQSVFFTPKMAVTDLPELSDIQEIVEELLLPKLRFAIQALDFLDDYPDYTFIISGRMQGDPLEDQLEIDLTEIYILEVSLNMLYAIANMSVAYEVDFFGYDSLEALNAFSPGGTFLTLRNGGEPMDRAKASLLKAFDKLRDGIAFLKAETDPQDDDIIKIGRDGPSLEELDQILEIVDEAESVLTENQTFTDNWDNDPVTPESDLTVNFGSLFDQPIQDWKSKLPDYTVTVRKQALEHDYEWYYGEHLIETQAQIEVDGTYSYYRNFSQYSDGDTYIYEQIDIDIPRLTEVFDSLLTEMQNIPNVGYYSLYVYFSQYLTTGTHSINASIYYNYEIRKPMFEVYIPVITWDADTFNNWIFPDPTLNGFLPGMTDQMLKTILGIDETDWEKTFD